MHGDRGKQADIQTLQLLYSVSLSLCVSLSVSGNLPALWPRVLLPDVQRCPPDLPLVSQQHRPAPTPLPRLKGPSFQPSEASMWPWRATSTLPAGFCSLLFQHSLRLMPGNICNSYHTSLGNSLFSSLTLSTKSLFLFTFCDPKGTRSINDC